MTPSRRAWTSSLAALACVAATVAAQGEPPPAAERPVLRVPAATAPALDGKVDAEEWSAGASFDVRRGEDVYGKGKVLRAGRNLYFAYESTLHAFALGLRLNFRDPVSMRMSPVVLMPLSPPRPPLALFRQAPGRQAEALPVDTCDVRLDLSELETFSLEARLPLDLLEFPRGDRPMEFSAEVWDLEANRPIGLFPLMAEGVGGAQVYARLEPAKDWGGEADTAPPPTNDALRLFADLQAADAEGAPAGPLAHTGWRDGRRREAPMAQFEARLEKALAERPEYVGLRATQVQLRLARNDHEGALEALEGIARDFPLLRHQSWLHLMKSELLRGLGRYDDALAHLEENGPALGDDHVVQAEKSLLRYLLRVSAMEDRIREEEGARDDLPRVRITVKGKGDLVIELFEDDAPNAVANFLSLVERGDYDGTKFHWVEGGRNVLGGDPNSRDDDPFNDGFGDPGYLVESEPSRRMHLRFTVGYADKRRARRTEGCAFVVHLAPFPQLDGVNTVFGRIVEGFDVVGRIEYGDVIASGKVLRKRDHPYEVAKRAVR